MNTKLTLRLDEGLIVRAKRAAEARGKSVSQMVGEFFSSLESDMPKQVGFPPITASLLGALKGRSFSEEDYHRHLEKKHSFAI